MNKTATGFWKFNKALNHLTPPGERYPEGDIHGILKTFVKGSVCEFGCGDGRLAPAFDDYYGMDINPYAVEAARKRNPDKTFGDDLQPADTVLAHTVLLHVPDDEIESVMESFQAYNTIVISEIMDRRWRRDGDPPVFNRNIENYLDLLGRPAQICQFPYPRYKTHFTVIAC